MSNNTSLYQKGLSQKLGGIPKMMSQIWLSHLSKSHDLNSKLKRYETQGFGRAIRFAMVPWVGVRKTWDVHPPSDEKKKSEPRRIWGILHKPPSFKGIFKGGFPKMGRPENQRTPYWKWQLLHDQSGSPINKKNKNHFLPWVDKFWNHDWLTLILRWQMNIFLQGIHYYNIDKFPSNKTANELVISHFATFDDTLKDQKIIESTNRSFAPPNHPLQFRLKPRCLGQRRCRIWTTCSRPSRSKSHPQGEKSSFCRGGDDDVPLLIAEGNPIQHD